MRRCFKIVGWMGMGLSALLVVATVAAWICSAGHDQTWELARFEPQPHWWSTGALTGAGVGRAQHIRLIRGHLWLARTSWAPTRDFKPRTESRRSPISANAAQQELDATFAPGTRSSGGHTLQAWRWAGAGFCRGSDRVDVQMGRPTYEHVNLALPFWMLAILFGLWPALFTARLLLEKKRYAAGLCQQCGYELRATPDPTGPRLKRCPECGRVSQPAG